MYYKSGGPLEELIRIGQLYFFGKDKMEELVLSGQSKGEKTREDT